MIIWDEQKINFLKINYIKYGGIYCSKILNIPIQNIRTKASILKLRRQIPDFTNQEIDFLKIHYNDFGAKYCANYLNCSTGRIRRKASNLGLMYLPIPNHYKICRGCWEKKLLSEFSPHKIAQLGIQSKCKICRAKWESNRKKYDKNYRILHVIRNRIRVAIKNNVKRGKSLELLGCSILELKKFLTSKFQPGMTWENHGKWHIDHIKPCSFFDMSKPEEQKKCFHYTNLQPLWAKDYLSKGDKCNN